MIITNRMERIEDVIQCYIDEQCRMGSAYASEPEQTILTDLLTDLRHYCSARNLDFEHSVKWSQVHHEAEESPQEE